MNKISSCLTRLFLLIFLGVTGYITFFTFKSWERAGFLYAVMPSAERTLLLIAGILFMAILSGLFLHFTRRLSHKGLLLFSILALTVLFLGQLILIFGIGQSTFMYDPYRVFDEALHMLSTHTVSGTAMEGYYGIYPNNISFTLICYWLLSLGSLFGLSDTGLMIFLQIINALCMDLAVFLMARILNNWHSSRSARLFLFLCLLNPLVYIWPGFAYTSTFSMPFISGALYLFLKMIHMEKPSHKICYGFLTGVTLIIGFKIRATVIITLIAALICLVLAFYRQIKAQIPAVISIFLAIAIGLGAWNTIQKHYVSFDTTDTAFPVVSWLAMGALYETDGMFNTQDYYDTKNAPTAAEKKAVNEQKLKERLHTLGFSGYIKLAGNKMVRTWADGTDDYVSYLNQYPDTGKLHTYLLEDKKDFVVSYMQIMRCFMFVFTFLGALYLLLSKKTSADQTNTGTLLLLQLNLLGGTFFHVLWETGELYSLCFSFLLFALTAAGYDNLIENAQEQLTRHPKLHYIPAATMLLLTLFASQWMIRYSDDFSQLTIKKHDTLISQKTYTSAEQKGLTQGSTLKQTFYADKPFNRVCVRVKNYIPENKDSAYHITVHSETGQMLLDTHVTGNDVFDYDYFYFGLPEEAAPETMTQYTITITCEKGNEQSSIAFLRYDTGHHDAYTPGELLENDIPVPNADLNFMVYRSYQDTYFSPGTWKLVCVMLLSLHLLLLAGVIYKDFRYLRIKKV